MHTTGMLKPYLTASYNHLRVIGTLTKSTNRVVLQLLKSIWILVLFLLHYHARKRITSKQTLVYLPPKLFKLFGFPIFQL